MKTKHTPGPWVLDGSVNDYGNQSTDAPILGTILGPFNTHVAVITSDLEMESIANAHLIAAAPEMLDTLVWLCRQMEAEQKAGVSGFEDWLAPARATLSKAQVQS